MTDRKEYMRELMRRKREKAKVEVPASTLSKPKTGLNQALRQALSPIPAEAGASGEIEFEGEMYPVKHLTPITEENYVQMLLNQAAQDIKREPLRKKRIEKYARWRYRGYLVGACASLS